MLPRRNATKLLQRVTDRTHVQRDQESCIEPLLRRRGAESGRRQRHDDSDRGADTDLAVDLNPSTVGARDAGDER